MPNDQDTNTGYPQDGESSMLRNVILLTLPWLSLQRDMLAIVKKGIEDSSHVKPVQNLALCELQALMMILDPKHKWRGPFGAALEKKVEELFNETVPKLVSGSIQLIEAQEIIVKRMNEALITLKNGHKPKSPTSEKVTE